MNKEDNERLRLSYNAETKRSRQTEEQDTEQPDDLLYDAWVLLANGAYWDHTDRQGQADWNAARDRWRDEWHKTL